MSISKPFIDRPIATSLLMVAIFVSGLLGSIFLSVSALPEIDFPTIAVTTKYPGASAQVMAYTVTAPLERQLGQMPGLKQMSSVSSNGLSLITLQFNLNLNLDVAEQQVQEAINGASGYLPSQLSNPPTYSKVNPADTPIMSLALISHKMSLAKVEDFVENSLMQKFSQISGVGLVSLKGGQRPSIRIQANTRQLASYGLSTQDIRNVITNANVNSPKGSFDGESVAYNINANDQLSLSQDYRNLIIAYTDKQPVRLCDVANVIDDVENNKQVAYLNGEQAIIINIQKQPGANVISVADAIKAILPQITKNLPEGIQLEVLSDRTEAIRSSVLDVELELLLAVLLVVIVMFLFLRSFSTTIVASLAMPLSLVGSLGLMYLLGIGINNLTLMALTIATGFVMDDAIVMIENINRYIEMGEKPLDAAYKGAKQIGFTILALTTSLLAVLIPLLFMGDIIGRLFREFAITLAIAIVISSFVSLTLIPMLSAKLFKEKIAMQSNSFTYKLEHWLNVLILQYAKSLKVVLFHQKNTLIVAISIVVITALLFIYIPKGFFPDQDNNAITAKVFFSEQASFAQVSKKQQEITKIIAKDPMVSAVASFVGIDQDNHSLNSSNMLLQLKPKNQRNHSISKIIANLKAQLQNIDAKIYFQAVQDLAIEDNSTASRYQFSISSSDDKELFRYAEVLKQEFLKIPQLQNIVSDQQNGGLALQLHINRDNATKLGVNMQSIVDALYDMYGQRQISTIFTQRNQYNVVLEALPNLLNGKKSLDNLYVKSSNNTMVPLMAFAVISEGKTPLLVTRQNQFSVINLSFDLAAGVFLGDALKAIHEAIAKLQIPPKLDLNFQGSAAAFEGSANNKIWLIMASIVVVYIVLGVLYESYIHPITILSTLPSACMGALLALMLCGKDLDVIAIIGIILLIGIVKKNAIMMIDFALEQQRNNNKQPIEAIFEACVLRFRPILMTSMAAFFGAVPLVAANSMGSEIRSPLGIAIIGGLLVSPLLTLYSTPVIYLAFDRLEQKFKS